jgi:hypothetical protein
MTTQPDDPFEMLTSEEYAQLELNIAKSDWDFKRNDYFVSDGQGNLVRPDGWSGLHCPTPCDPSCEANCHERHKPKHKRDHEIGMCLDEDYYPEHLRG